MSSCLPSLVSISGTSLCISLSLAACSSGAVSADDLRGELPDDEVRVDTEEADWEKPPAELDSAAQPDGDVERPDYVDSTGFFVRDGRLYDAFENEFVMRGVNNAHAWFGGAAEGALDELAGFGFNLVRIVWETGDNADALRRVFYTCVTNQLIPMLELHDATGSNSVDDLLVLAEFLTEPEVKALLMDYEQYVLVNIANEWSGNDTDFLAGYSEAIDTIRDAEIPLTLVIDANGWGQNAGVIDKHALTLLDHDPQHNLVFSNHMYESFSGRNSYITEVMENAVAKGIPYIVGEFGWQHGRPDPRPIDVEHIFAEASRLGLGLVPWSWKGNSADVAYLDMSEDWSGESLTQWGEQVIHGENGVAETSLRASVFVLAE